MSNFLCRSYSKESMQSRDLHQRRKWEVTRSAKSLRFQGEHDEESPWEDIGIKSSGSNIETFEDDQLVDNNYDS